MKKTRTRVFSILLACALVLGMMPVGVFAGTTATASNESELKNAIEGANESITLTKDIEITAPILLNGNKNIIINGDGHEISFKHSGDNTLKTVFTGSADGEVEGIPAGVNLTVNNVQFININGDQKSQGYAVLVGSNSYGTVIKMNGCTFENLYCGVIANYQKKPTDGNKDKYPEISITDSRFINTTYGYSIDETTLGSVIGAIDPTFTGNQDGDGNSIAATAGGEPWFEVYGSNQDIKAKYNNLIDALKNAGSGDTVVMGKDVVVTDAGLTNSGDAAIKVPAGVTLDGNGLTITAEGWTNKKKFHIIGVSETGKNTTTIIKNLNIVGNADTKSGIHAYKCEGTVKISNVDIKECGNAAVQVNGSKVTASNLTTSGNAWGAVNVDKGSGVTTTALFEVGEGCEFAEPFKVWTELTEEENGGIDPVDVPDTWKPVLGSTTAYAPEDSLTEQVVKNENTDVYYQTLQDAAAAADDGQTLSLASGTYDLDGQLTLSKTVSIKGAGAEDTIVIGNIMYGATATAEEESMTVEGITLCATDSNNHLGLCWNNWNVLDGYTLNVKNCVFDGWQYGVGVNSQAQNCKLNVTDTVFSSVFCAVSVKTDTNTVSMENITASQGGYALQSFGYENSTLTENGYYFDYTTYANNELADWDALNSPGDGNVPTWPAAAAIGTKYYDTIDQAIDDVKDDETILVIGEITGDIVIDKNVKDLTIKGAGGVIKNGSLTVASNGIQLLGLTITGLNFENANIQMSPNGDSDLTGMEISKNSFTGAVTNSAVHLNFGSKSEDGTGTAFNDLVITGNEIKDITSGSNSGILIIGDGKTDSNLTITDNKVNGVGWNGIQINNVAGAEISVTGNELSNCGATEGVINLYNSNAQSFKVNENKVYANETQKYVCYICSDVDLGYNYWGTTTPDFKDNLGYTTNNGNEPDDIEVVTEPYYEADTMRPQDLNTYVPSGGGGGTVETKYDISVDSAANGTVKASASTSAKDKTVTLTVTPDEGYVLDTLTVTDKDGKNVELTKKSDTEYTFKMPSSKVTVKAVFKEEAVESTLPFTDVSDADWFYPAVKYVYDNDMMNGVSDDRFAPASQLTRGMIAQVLYNLEKVTGDFDGSFTDVAADEWYADAVNWAAECGIVNGFGDGTFGPEQNITREQMAQILMNYAKYKGYDVTAKGDVSAFTDAAEISGWAQDAVSWAVAEKLLSGKGNGILDPAGTATRAEVAQIFMNFCENIAK